MRFLPCALFCLPRLKPDTKQSHGLGIQHIEIWKKDGIPIISSKRSPPSCWKNWSLKCLFYPSNDLYTEDARQTTRVAFGQNLFEGRRGFLNRIQILNVVHISFPISFWSHGYWIGSCRGIGHLYLQVFVLSEFALRNFKRLTYPVHVCSIALRQRTLHARQGDANVRL